MPARKTSAAGRKKRSSSSRMRSRAHVADPTGSDMPPEVPELHMKLSDVITSQVPTEPPTAPAPEPSPEPASMPGPQESSSAMACSNCGHMPMDVNVLVALLVALTIVLSTLVVIS